MAADLITFSTSARKINERSSMVVTTRFRNRAAAADVIPTNIKYRVDGPMGVITDWSAVTPAASVNITLTTTENSILDDTRSIERRLLTVASDYGLTTQYIDSMRYEVRNLPLYT